VFSSYICVALSAILKHLCAFDKELYMHNLLSLALMSSFDPSKYESAVSEVTPIGKHLFTAYFVINSPVTTISYVSFDIMDDMWVGETLDHANFLINGSVPPFIIRPPFQTMYRLTISTGRNFYAAEIRENITFNIFSHVRATNGNDISSAYVTLYGTGNFIVELFCHMHYFVACDDIIKWHNFT